jgi:hypothetical protein
MTMTLKPTDAASPLQRLRASVTAGSVIAGVTTAITGGEPGTGGDASQTPRALPPTVPSLRSSRSAGVVEQPGGRRSIDAAGVCREI